MINKQYVFVIISFIFVTSFTIALIIFYAYFPISYPTSNWRIYSNNALMTPPIHPPIPLTGNQLSVN